jgi:hypothetical protein
MRKPFVVLACAGLLLAVSSFRTEGQAGSATCITNPDTAAYIRDYVWQLTTRFPLAFVEQSGFPGRPGVIAQVDDDRICARAAHAIDALYPLNTEPPRWQRVVVLRVGESRYVVTGPYPHPQYHVVFDFAFQKVGSAVEIQ